MKNVLVAFLTLLAILLLIVEQGQSFSFDDVENQLVPCFSYVIGQDGDTPSSECCNGVKAVELSLPTRVERRAACDFLKSFARVYPLLNNDKVSSLLKQCAPTIAFPFSKEVNCQR
ncbi:putative plant lipid transfer protein/Par allergen [Lupinus albus]|uniref:Putative plant lipid transfer protein/Par allergen n=1 Tax=Lupinus albus TaxID=3870 RepID=A0A6A4QDV6_LUPAL|nr:putative plant lipid transfer protein/Par allergen [Lupinus albus]